MPCSATTADLCKEKECEVCLDKSLAGESAKADMARVGVQFLADMNARSTPLRLIPKRSNVLVTFLCLVCLLAIPPGAPLVLHVFTAKPADVLGTAIGESPCPYEKKALAKVCGQEGCTRCGLAAHADALAARNLKFEAGFYPGEHASSYTASSNRMCTWRCMNADCGHTFPAMVKNVMYNESGCPFCAKGTGQFCKTACAPCRKRSLASWFDLSTSRFEWSPANTPLDPARIGRSSMQPVRVVCKGCRREMEAIPAQLTIAKYSKVCPCCSGRHRCEAMSCVLCLRKSVAGYREVLRARGIAWADKADARTVPRGRSTVHYLWVCLVATCQTVWSAFPLHVTRETGCPACAYKTEKRVLDFLIGKHPSWTAWRGARYGWAVHRQRLPFDIVVRDAGTGRLLVLEVDGPHHFVDMIQWDNAAAVVRCRDIYKMYCALTAGAAADSVVGIIRLHQEDVWLDRIPWQQQLESAIAGMLNAPVLAAGVPPPVVYLARNAACYDLHRADLAAAFASAVPPTYNPAGEDDDDDADADVDADANADADADAVTVVRPAHDLDNAGSPVLPEGGDAAASPIASPLLRELAIAAPPSPLLLPAALDVPAVSSPVLAPTAAPAVVSVADENDATALFGQRATSRPAISMRLVRKNQVPTPAAAAVPTPAAPEVKRSKRTIEDFFGKN